MKASIAASEYIRGIASKYGVPMALHEALLQKLESSDFRCFYTGVPLVPGINACVDHLHSRSLYPDKLSDLSSNARIHTMSYIWIPWGSGKVTACGGNVRREQVRASCAVPAEAGNAHS